MGPQDWSLVQPNSQLFNLNAEVNHWPQASAATQPAQKKRIVLERPNQVFLSSSQASHIEIGHYVQHMKGCFSSIDSSTYLTCLYSISAKFGFFLAVFADNSLALARLLGWGSKTQGIKP